MYCSTKPASMSISWGKTLCNQTLVVRLLKVDLKQFEGMNVATARKNKEQEEDALDLKNKRNPKATKEKTLKEVAVV